MIYNERDRRLFAGFLAELFGFRGVKKAAEVTGLAEDTVRRGKRELNGRLVPSNGRIRCEGGGRPTKAEEEPHYEQKLESLIEDDMAGDPMTGKKWVRKTLRWMEKALEMDGVPDYKQLIDIDRDGVYDIKRYGIGNETVSSESTFNIKTSSHQVKRRMGDNTIIWHTTITDYEVSQKYVEINKPESYRTQWFDIDDQLFSNFSIDSSESILGIVGDVLLGGLLNVIGEFFLPPMDYWAQRSLTQSVDSSVVQSQEFYSVSVDLDKDGNTDKSIVYQKTSSTTYYKIDKKETTIFAAKPQNIWSLMFRNVAEVFTGVKEVLYSTTN
jgi:hypothetical protein